MYFICNIKNSAWKCISQMKLLFFIFIYIFLWKKRFFSKKIFQYKTFFSYKNIFSANNSYIFKNRYIFSKTDIFFFNLDLQQMSNHSWLPEFSDLGLIGLDNYLTNIEPMLHSHLKLNKDLHSVKWLLVITIIYIFLVFRGTKIFLLYTVKMKHSS